MQLDLQSLWRRYFGNQVFIDASTLPLTEGSTLVWFSKTVSLVTYQLTLLRGSILPLSVGSLLSSCVDSQPQSYLQLENIKHFLKPMLGYSPAQANSLALGNLTMSIWLQWLHKILSNMIYLTKGFPSGSAGKESACNVGDLGLIPGFGKTPWRREWQLTPVFLPGKSYGQRSPAGCSPWGLKDSDMTERLSMAQHIFNKGKKWLLTTRANVLLDEIKEKKNLTFQKSKCPIFLLLFS